MDLRSYFNRMTDDEKAEYAERVGTSLTYLKTHLMAKKPTRTPRRKLLDALYLESEGKVSQSEAIDHFYG